MAMNMNMAAGMGGMLKDGTTLADVGLAAS